MPFFLVVSLLRIHARRYYSCNYKHHRENELAVRIVRPSPVADSSSDVATGRIDATTTHSITNRCMGERRRIDASFGCDSWPVLLNKKLHKVFALSQLPRKQRRKKLFSILLWALLVRIALIHSMERENRCLRVRVFWGHRTHDWRRR